MTIHTELVTTPEAKPQDKTWPNQSLRKPQEGINFLSRMSDLPHSAFSTDPQKDKDGKQCSAVQLIPAFFTEQIHKRLPEESGRVWEGCKWKGRGRVLNQVL